MKPPRPIVVALIVFLTPAFGAAQIDLSLPHHALGHATLDAHHGSLVVGNIGSTGDDGFAVTVARARSYLCDWAPLGAAGPLPVGSHFEFRCFGTSFATPEFLFGSARVTRIGHGVEFSVDYSHAGVSGHVVEVLLDGKVVARVAGLADPSIVTGNWPVSGGFRLVELGLAGRRVPRVAPEPTPAVEWGLGGIASVLIVDRTFAPQDTTVYGDAIRVIPLSRGGLDAITSVHLLAKQIPTITITDETAEPVVPPLIRETSDAFKTALEDPSSASQSMHLTASPNPTRDGSVRVLFRLPTTPSAWELSVFDASGRRIRALAEGSVTAGGGTLAWDGRDDGGRAVPSGAYFLRLVSGESQETHRVTLLR